MFTVVCWKTASFTKLFTTSRQICGTVRTVLMFFFRSLEKQMTRFINKEYCMFAGREPV